MQNAVLVAETVPQQVVEGETTKTSRGRRNRGKGKKGKKGQGVEQVKDHISKMTASLISL